jgi:hypothetical protein
MEQTKYSETSAYKIQTPRNYPEESIPDETKLLKILNPTQQYWIWHKIFPHSLPYSMSNDGATILTQTSQTWRPFVFILTNPSVVMAWDIHINTFSMSISIFQPHCLKWHTDDYRVRFAEFITRTNSTEVLAKRGFKVSVAVTSIHLAQTVASRHTCVIFKSAYTSKESMAFALKYSNLLEAGQFSSFRIKTVTLQAFGEQKSSRQRPETLNVLQNLCTYWCNRAWLLCCLICVIPLVLFYSQS